MKELKEKLILNEDDEEIIPEVEVIEEEPKQEEIDTGMYNIISQEIRDTLQDIENLKSIIATLKATDSGKEEVVASLESIIDERTIHVGMLQTILDSFSEGTQELIDQGVESIEEEPKEEIVVDSNVDKLV